MKPFRSSRRCARRDWFALVVGIIGAVWTASHVQAADPRASTTSNEARREATAALPLAKLNEKDRQAAAFVVQNTSIYRRMPTEVIECDPQLFSLLIDNPEIMTNLWQLMKISDVRLQRTGPSTFRADDGQGTIADIKIMHRAHDCYVIYAEGAYSGPLMAKPVRGRCVLLLRTAEIQETNGRHYITCRLDSFLHMERVGVELLAKTFHPLFGHAADSNFTETLAFVGHLSRTCALNPTGTARMAQLLTQVEPHTRTQFGIIAQDISQRHQALNGIRPAGHQTIADNDPKPMKQTNPR